MPDVINEAVESSARQGLPGIIDPNAPRERRKSRWSTNKAFVHGMPTILPSNLDDTQRQGYLRMSWILFYTQPLLLSVQLEIEDATRKLRLADFSVPDGVERFGFCLLVYRLRGVIIKV